MVQSIFAIYYLRNYFVSYVSTYLTISIDILFYIQAKKDKLLIVLGGMQLNNYYDNNSIDMCYTATQMILEKNY